MSPFVVLTAVLLDVIFAEPKKYHPLVGFGRLATAVEQQLRRLPGRLFHPCLQGVVAWLFIVALPVWLAAILAEALPVALLLLVEVLVLYLAIGFCSLRQHALEIFRPLQANELAAARTEVAKIVSRDIADLNESQVAAAAVESVLENGSDAVFAPLFWFLVAGLPGVLGYRLINTLDAMWGYRNSRYRHFGWMSARMDDLANWIPARLTAISYCLAGKFATGWRAMRTQGGLTDSPNAGRVMAAGAGALDITVGGTTNHGGEPQWRPQLGYGKPVQSTDIQRAIRLLERTLVLWMVAGIVAAGGGCFLYG